jgi:hypothetical protein
MGINKNINLHMYMNVHMYLSMNIKHKNRYGHGHGHEIRHDRKNEQHDHRGAANRLRADIACTVGCAWGWGTLLMGEGDVLIMKEDKYGRKDGL